MIVYNSTLVDFDYDAGNRYGIGIWHGQAIDEEYKKAMNFIAKLIEENKLDCWIGDMTKLEFISPELQTWTNEVWFPKVIELGLKNIGIVVSETALARMSVNQIMLNVGDTTSKHFSNVNDAKAWIADID